MRILRAMLGILTLVGVSNSQTIHRDDFDYFVGCFARTGDYVDLSKFIEWRIMRPEADGVRRGLNSIEYSGDKRWVYDWEPLSNQNRSSSGRRYRLSSQGFEFYILMDLFGHERQRNVLTAWKRIGKDSLQYHCGQTGDFDSFIGASRVERIKTFPDQSILLVVGSGGEGYKERFYKKQWSIPYGESGGSYVNIHYNFEHLRRSSYKVTEVSEYISLTPTDSDYGTYETTVDSASVEIIDLWEMARKHFGLKNE
jgi:hypothetical protein